MELADGQLEDLMEPWRVTWRHAAPLISTEGLMALKTALEIDDQRLIQGATTSPPPLMCVQDRNVEAACLLGFCGWRGDGLETVGKVEEYFAKMAFAIDQNMAEPAGVRHLLNAYDEWPRDEMIRNLLPEVERELKHRAARKRACTVA